MDTGAISVSGGNYEMVSWGSLASYDTVNRNGVHILTYEMVENLTLNAGTGSDIINVAATRAGTSLVVRGGLGDDIFRVDGRYVQAGAVTFDGQGGTDTLDYSTYTAGVRVNLALGTATRVAGGVSNIENVIGGQGDDILIGDDQANVLNGGAGRDILVGRGGADQLLGGSDDDILIGGSTAYDLLPDRWETIMQEWGRHDLSGTWQEQYDARINDIRFGGGLNGSVTLGLSQVTDDGAVDVLSGSWGLDWFFMQGADTISDGLQPGERIN